MTPRTAHVSVSFEPRRAFALALVLLGAAAVSFWTVSRPLVVEEALETSGSEPLQEPARVASSPLRAAAVHPTAHAAPAAVAYHERDPNEWQGMRVKREGQPPCSAADSCGLALACIEGRCGACNRDAECASGETCVLDHCVRSERAECRRRADCSEPDAVCALSGYSGGDRRSNSEMRAYCLVPRGVASPASGASIRSGGPEAEPGSNETAVKTISPQSLLEAVQRRSAEKRKP